jgi:hypothetical protein
MRSHHLTIAGALWALVLAVSALAPTAALAGPLLSGYGGPGVGNQAILGSALLNGPSGGGSGGEASAGGGATLAAGGEAGARVTQHARGGAPTGSGKRSNRSVGKAGKASSGGTRAHLETSAPASSREHAGGAQAPVLSATSLLYVLLALGVLVLTGAFTRGLTRQPG